MGEICKTIVHLIPLLKISPLKGKGNTPPLTPFIVYEDSLPVQRLYTVSQNFSCVPSD